MQGYLAHEEAPPWDPTVGQHMALRWSRVPLYGPNRARRFFNLLQAVLCAAILLAQCLASKLRQFQNGRAAFPRELPTNVWQQEYLAHKKTPTPLGLP